jgi:hypothetical protein
MNSADLIKQSSPTQNTYMQTTTPLSQVNPLLNTILLLQNRSDNAATKALTIEAMLTIIPKKFFVEEDIEGNLLFDNRPRNKRELPVPTIVAHLDQVHDYARGLNLVLIGNKSDKIVAYDRHKRRVGTGGDDKCGVYVAVKMLMSDVPCRVILTQDEEIGCIGAGEVRPSWGELSSILLQADRRGNNDLIKHTNGGLIASKDLVDRVLALPECKGMKPEYGSVTDVGDLCVTFDVAGFNISAGYYNAHQRDEWIILSELEQCFDRIKAIATMVGNEVETLPEYEPRNYNYGMRGYSYYSDDLDEIPLSKRNSKAFCLLEGRTYLTDEGTTVGPMVAMQFMGTTVYMQEGFTEEHDAYWLENGRCSSGSLEDYIDVTQL